MHKPWTDEEEALLGTQPDLLLAERLGRTPQEISERRALLKVAPHCAPRTHGKARVYLSRDEGLEPLSDDDLVRVSRQLGVEGAVVRAVHLQHERGLPPEEAARIAGVHAETVAAWVRAGAASIA